MAKHLAAVAGSFVVLGVVNAGLNASYEASGHPVAYAEGQTTFSGERIRGFYEVMEQAGTLSTYVWTQVIDFGFIAAMALFGICLSSILVRLNRDGSLGHRAGQVVGYTIPAGALFDVAENLVSFVMLADSQNFPDWLAFPYSGFAVIKFALIALGMIAATISTIAWIAGRVFGRRS